MSNNKQSSVVDFIYNELFVVKRWMDLTPGDIEYIFKQAKAKHKDEVINAVVWFDDTDRRPHLIEIEVEQYYNETFGGQDANI